MTEQMGTSNSMEIREIQTFEDAEKVVSLIRQFVQWLRERYGDIDQEVDTYFKKEGLEEELAAISRLSLPAHRKIFVAIDESEAAGTVMLNRIDETTCQMNRLFVSSKFRGRKVGRQLCLYLIEVARELGYQRMRLHTTQRQTESRQLYLSLGFQKCAPYGAGGSMAEYFELWLDEIGPTQQ
jgi:GNAT superfamily N-acetyltransferase